MNNIWLIFGLILKVLLVTTMGQEQECEEKQFSQTRINYENCASKKIHEITSWLQREELEGEVKEEGVTAVCMAVRQLIHDCGNALSFCFSDSQVEETKQKQRTGLKSILAKHYSQQNMEKCFLRDPEPVTEPSTTTTTDPTQDEEIVRNIEALIEFTTPTSTVPVSFSVFTTPVITPKTTKFTTLQTTPATTKTPTSTTTTSTFTTPVTINSQKTTTTDTTTTAATTSPATTTTPAATTTPAVTTTPAETTTIPTTTTPKTTPRSQKTTSIIIEITTRTPQTTTPTTKTPATTPQTKSQQTQIILREKLVSSASTTTTTTTTITPPVSSTTTIPNLPTKSTFHDFDTGTTHSPVEPFKCEEKEFTETRDNYERCASNKIREITAWLERKERRRRRRAEEEGGSILTVCNAVRQLLYDCGNELGWCFTEDQVSETRFKQREGLETILSKHYTPEKLEMCFVQENTQELVNISQVLDNQTEENAESGAMGSKDNVPAIEDISENIISDSSDRHPRVFPSTKKSSASRVKTSSFLQFFILIIFVATFT